MTPAVQDYLKAIYALSGEEGGTTTTALARRLHTTPAAITKMVKHLAIQGVVEHEPYYGVRLTPAGADIASEMVRHHRLLERYLTDMLGYSPESVHDEAERLEHHISEEFEDRIAELLGNPTVDPHGRPIPLKAERELAPFQRMSRK